MAVGVDDSYKPNILLTGAHVSNSETEKTGVLSPSFVSPAFVKKTEGSLTTSSSSTDVDTLPAPVSLTVANADPPPDGGWQAWSQVVAGHLIAFNAWGFINSFGIFQAYLTTCLSRSPSDISWIGSTQTLLLMLLGTVSGRLLDAGYYRHVAVAGMTLQVIGIMTSSAITEYWQLFLAQGICQGLGNGLIFPPTMAVVSTYFSKAKRSRAIMGMASGTATGGVIFPLIASRLLDKIGFGWTIRIMGLIILFNSVIAIALVKPRLAPRKSGPIMDLRSFLDPWYGFAAFGLFFCTLGLYVGYFYVTVFAQDVVHVSQQTSFEILIASNAIGLPSRYIQAYLADKVWGPTNGMMLSSAITGIVSLAWIAVRTTGGTYAFAIVYGFFGATITTFFSAALGNDGRDPRRAGMEMGMFFSLCGISCFIGPPIAGSIITATGGSFLGAQLFTGLSLLLGTILVAIARQARAGRKLFVAV